MIFIFIVKVESRWYMIWGMSLLIRVAATLAKDADLSSIGSLVSFLWHTWISISISIWEPKHLYRSLSQLSRYMLTHARINLCRNRPFFLNSPYLIHISISCPSSSLFPPSSVSVRALLSNLIPTLSSRSSLTHSLTHLPIYIAQSVPALLHQLIFESDRAS